jgi:transposase
MYYRWTHKSLKKNIRYKRGYMLLTTDLGSQYKGKNIVRRDFEPPDSLELSLQTGHIAFAIDWFLRKI